MSGRKIKSRVKKISLSLAIVLAPLVFAAQSYATTQPYFKAYGGNVFAGGWFSSGQNACNSTDPSFQASTTSPIKGGILAFVKSAFDPNSPDGGNTGASSELGALALGTIKGITTSSNGYRGFFAGGDGTANLSFANVVRSGQSVSEYGGGFFEGGTPNSNDCVPDYWSSGGAPAASGSTLFSGSDVNAMAAPKTATNADVTLNSTQISNGKNLSLFVSGNIYITGDITYAPGYNESNVPKLAIVAKGNIFIGKDVHRLDGFYIAQPDSSGNNGDIWTCHETDNVRDPSGPWVAQNCNSNLTIKGAVVAKRIDLARVQGNVGTAGTNGDCNSASSSGNVAEVMCFTPEMVVGGSFFNSSNTSSGRIQSLINLPPVF